MSLKLKLVNPISHEIPLQSLMKIWLTFAKRLFCSGYQHPRALENVVYETISSPVDMYFQNFGKFESTSCRQCSNNGLLPRSFCHYNVLIKRTNFNFIESYILELHLFNFVSELFEILLLFKQYLKYNRNRFLLCNLLVK